MSEATRSRELLDELAAERNKGRNIRRGITYAVLVMFALAIGNVYFKVKNFDTETFVTVLQRETTAQVWPLIEREIDVISRDAGPALSKALADEAAAFAPKFSAAVAVEGVAFSEHLHQRMKSSLDGAFTHAVAGQQEKLHAQFPQFKDDTTKYDELVARLNAAAQSWAMAQLDTTFKAHIDVLQSINEQVALLAQVSAEDRAKNGDPQAEEVLELFLGIMNSRLEGEKTK
jgi:hypothetical protein